MLSVGKVKYYFFTGKKYSHILFWIAVNYDVN